MYEQAGLPDAIVPFVVKEHEDSPFVDNVEDWDRISGLLDSLLSQESVTRDRLGPPLARVLRDMALTIYMDITGEALYDALVPLFEAALAQPGISAWVAANDAIALHALRFPRQAHKRAPQDVSVIGFDDTPQASVSGLTRYNFDTRAVVHAMLMHLAEHPAALSARAERVTEVQGFVTRRGTAVPVKMAEARKERSESAC